jgi:hypothetical protein
LQNDHATWQAIATLLPRHLGHDTVKHHLVKAVWDEVQVTAVAVNRYIAAGAILRVLKVALGAAQFTICCVKVEAPAPADRTRLASLYGSCGRAHGAPQKTCCAQSGGRQECKFAC